jgi:hypothetical protein
MVLLNCGVILPHLKPSTSSSSSQFIMQICKGFSSLMGVILKADIVRSLLDDRFPMPLSDFSPYLFRTYALTGNTKYDIWVSGIFT